jgi:riboflavin kinase, archaea type
VNSAAVATLKASYIPTLVELLELGAKDRPISITTTELGQKLGKSQQLASKHLEEMEREGLVERIRSGGKTYVKLTKKGISAGASLYSTLSRVYSKDEKERLEVVGTVFSGLGEGAYYISLKGYSKQFLSKLGWEPFPGTMNLKLDLPVYRKIRRDLQTMKGIHIDGFKDGKRTFGGAECFRAILNGRAECAVLVIERTIHDDSVLEIVSPVNLRKQFKLKDGDQMTVEIMLEPSEGI